MSAYNRVNGEPCSASPTLLAKILRDEWGFDGYVVSDCWAIRDIHEGHDVTGTPAESAALAVKAGCDLNCGCTYEHIPAAVAEGLLTEADVDRCVRRLFRGAPPPRHVRSAGARGARRDPLRGATTATPTGRSRARRPPPRWCCSRTPATSCRLRSDLRSVAVIGPNADDREVLLGNYFGEPSRIVTPLEARSAPPSRRRPRSGTRRGASASAPRPTASGAPATSRRRSASPRAPTSVVLCLGLAPDIEGEQGDAGNSEAAGDKADLGLTGLQQALLEKVVALGKPTVLAVLAGSPLDLAWAHDHVGAIVQAWYPGAEGGAALADVLFGAVSPAGRLPVTFPRRAADLPPIADYRMQGRTYRYLETPPLYPFGYGLSYTRFAYRDLTVSAARATAAADLRVTVGVTVENIGAPRRRRGGPALRDRSRRPRAASPTATCAASAACTLGAGRITPSRASCSPRAICRSSTSAAAASSSPAASCISVGGSQPDERSAALTGTRPLAAELELVGSTLPLPY